MGQIKAAAPATALRRTSSAGGGGSGSIVLEKYQLGRLLGRGSFAKVYLARSLENVDEEVAIKVIDKATTAAAMEPLILREVSAMRRLRHHPNVLELHEVMATKSKIYLVMELAHGGELFARLHRSHRFSESTARKYFQQVISALSFCHQNGVVHRDIKPQNLLLDRNGSLKITDFGLSAFSDQKIDGLVRTACGTPAYTAPEVICGKAYDGEKADAWSCGVLLYVFLTGSLPFDDSNLPKMCRAMHNRSYALPEWLSKPARSVIRRLMEPNPNHRLNLAQLSNLSWFKKSIPKEASDTIFYQETVSPRANAFDIISMSSGLDLSALFEPESRNKIVRLTCGTVQLVQIEERVMKAGEELGYKVNRRKCGGIVLAKGPMAAAVVEVWEVSPEVWLVEMKVVVDGGAAAEAVQWEELKSVVLKIEGISATTMAD
ncbi:CBL-interacting serine/threonine-protein kinase 7-like [Andrographis paniculata]|uniref:CBL-interacting serine/threonine-protein kinase 7-like n=1 Tax=Andrographis paniculata TaxID=175694 RepID=UPI0021E7190C|nr:CBL-interacting serine/threonine-protein kinase 7-like [Andrographis paniculata]